MNSKSNYRNTDPKVPITHRLHTKHVHGHYCLLCTLLSLFYAAPHCAKTNYMYMYMHVIVTLQISRRSQGPPAENGLPPDSSSPSIPAPIRASNIPIELPKSLDRKMTLDDFSFLKVKSILLRFCTLIHCMCIIEIVCV